jgi:hypothetical protein
LNLPALTVNLEIWIVPAIAELGVNVSSLFSYVPLDVNDCQLRLSNVIVSTVVSSPLRLTRTLTSDVFDT